MPATCAGNDAGPSSVHGARNPQEYEWSSSVSTSFVIRPCLPGKKLKIPIDARSRVSRQISPWSGLAMSRDATHKHTTAKALFRDLFRSLAILRVTLLAAFFLTP